MSSDVVVDGFDIVTRLASTRHSSVYIADRVANKERVVLKVFQKRSDAEDGTEAYERFLQEFALVADVRHPNVVTIFEQLNQADHSCIVMEYLGGGTLKHQIRVGIREHHACIYLKKMASALAAIHKIGVLHLDLKPSNVMFRDNGTLALIDFGLAKRMRLELALTDRGDIFGTPFYMSPEQGHGQPTSPPSDIYSLGIIFYEMLTGKRPYESDSAMGIIYKHARAPVPLLPPRVAHYQILINMMLAKKPTDRIQSAEDIPTWL